MSKERNATATNPPQHWLRRYSGVTRPGMSMLAALFALVVTPAQAGDMKSRLETAPAVVWAGVDYSASVFFVPETFDNPDERTYFAPKAGLDEEINRYSKPDQAWKDLTADWNTIAQNVLLGKLEMALQREIAVDLPDPAGQTKKSPPYFLSQYDYKTTPAEFDRDDVQALIKKYRLSTRQGIAFVIIVERASKIEKVECVWPTFFDIQKREILSTERVCEKPGGTTFRDLWVKPVLTAGQDTVKALEKGEL